MLGQERVAPNLRFLGAPPRSDKLLKNLHVQHMGDPESELANTDTHIITRVMVRAACSLGPTGASRVLYAAEWWEVNPSNRGW